MSAISERRSGGDASAGTPTGLVTFLFTDIEGSTRLWEEYAESMRMAPRAATTCLLRQAIGQHRGFIFKTGGDAFYAAFASATDGRGRGDGRHAAGACHGAMARTSGHSRPDGIAYRGGGISRRRLLRAAAQSRRAHDGRGPRRANARFGRDARGLRRDRCPTDASLVALGEFTFKRSAAAANCSISWSIRACGRRFPRCGPLPPRRRCPSIAVLPFVNMSHDEENEYFADGLSEELLNVLAKIKGLARGVAHVGAHLQGQGDRHRRRLAQQLQVANVLAGSVRKAGKRVRISTQLVEAAKDETLWSETYDRELDDIFAVQDDIAQSVVQELRERLLGKPADGSEAAKVIAEVQAASKGRSDNPEAYRLYLQGQFFRDQLNQDATARAVECYQQALKLDPEYALALAGLSRAMSDLAGQNWIPRTDGYEIARTAAQKAVTLEPTLPEAHTALGWVLGWYDWNWKAADAVVPAGAGARAGQHAGDQRRGDVLRQSRQPRCARSALFRRAVGLDPLNVPVNRNLGLYCLAAGAHAGGRGRADQDTAAQHAKRDDATAGAASSRLARGPSRRSPRPTCRRRSARSSSWSARRSSSMRAAMCEASDDGAGGARSANTARDSPYQVAEVYGARGEADKAFEWLEKTYADRDPGLSYMKMDPNARQDPRAIRAGFRCSGRSGSTTRRSAAAPLRERVTRSRRERGAG